MPHQWGQTTYTQKKDVPRSALGKLYPPHGWDPGILTAQDRASRPVIDRVQAVKAFRGGAPHRVFPEFGFRSRSREGLK